MCKLFAVDLDRTLTKESCWTLDQCLKAEPRKDVVELVNTLYRSGHIIIIWTARREFLRPVTEYWLKTNNVFYHAVQMGKMGADAYIDDKAINAINYDNLLKGIQEIIKQPSHSPEVR
jgi:hypothetical protein